MRPWRELLALALALDLAARAAAKWPASQGDQDDVLQDLFYGRIGTTNRFAVEFGGCPEGVGSNTLRLRGNNTPPLRVQPKYSALHSPWDALLLEGNPKCKPSPRSLRPNAHEGARSVVRFRHAMIGSDTIVGLFEKYGVPTEPDYVSIDLDSVDLWVLRSLLGPASKFRPRVVSIEYNSNFGADGSLTMPDTATMLRSPFNFTAGEMAHPEALARAYPLPSCYQGATAQAIEQAANQLGYVVVNRTLGLDLFLVRKDLWRWAVPSLDELRLERCMNAPMSREMASNLLDYSVYALGEGTAEPKTSLVCRANRQAAKQLRHLAKQAQRRRGGGCGCFKHLEQPLPESAACRELAGLPRDARPGGYFGALKFGF